MRVNIVLNMVVSFFGNSTSKQIHEMIIFHFKNRREKINLKILLPLFWATFKGKNKQTFLFDWL